MTNSFVRFALAACLAAFFSSTASAALTLQLSNGMGNSVTITDQSLAVGMADANLAEGAITFIGGVGNFTVNISTGISYPVLGSPEAPVLFINSIDIVASASAPTELEILLSHTNFATNGSARFLASIAGDISPTLGATIDYRTFLGENNMLFSQGTLLTDLDFTGGGFAGADSVVVVTTAPYSLTQFITIGLPAGANMISLDAVLQVPEPATLLLFGLALAGLGFGSRLRARVRSA